MSLKAKEDDDDGECRVEAKAYRVCALSRLVRQSQTLSVSGKWQSSGKRERETEKRKITITTTSD